MVSKASDDLPEPLRPVMTTSLSRGISSVRFLRLCSRAPPILIKSFAMDRDFLDQSIHQHSRNNAGWEEGSGGIAGNATSRSRIVRKSHQADCQSAIQPIDNRR